MSMNKLRLAIFAASLMSTISYADVTATVTGATDYIYDGISQTDNGAALQGSIDFSHDQFYAGIWASNIDFTYDADAKQEVDYYIGWADSINDHVSYDLTALYYQYPGTDHDYHYNYVEYTAKLTVDNSWITVGYDPNYSGDAGHSWLARLGHDYAINDIYKLSAEIGTHKMTESKSSEYWYGHDKYNYWKLGVSREFMGCDVDLSYTDTNIKHSNDDDDVARAAIVLTVGKTF
jgi:uncharacterized protein (TIGR02001 family)